MRKRAIKAWSPRFAKRGPTLPWMIAWVAAIVLFIALASSCGGNVKRTSWTLSAAPNGNELQIAVMVGGCDSFSHIQAIETESTVTIAAYLNQDDVSGCDDFLGVEPKTVQLRTPVGDRSLEGCNPHSSVYQSPDLLDSDCRASIVPLSTAIP